jgi:hypothetical protein
MTQLNLFDAVQLREPIPLDDGEIAPAGTPGAIVEIFKDGEAYLIELFGGWVKQAGQGWIPSEHSDLQVFRQTIGVETVYPHQLHLISDSTQILTCR